MNPHYPVVAERAGHRCEYCRAPEVIFNLPFEVKHILPSSQGGSDGLSNLALSCRGCNLYKSTRIGGLDVESQTEVRLFNPRIDAWDDHFSPEDATGALLPRSAIGRLTIEVLRMNRSVQRTARLHWIRLGIFP